MSEFNPAAQHLLELRSLSKSFGRVDVLHGIDLDVSSGDVVCVIRPSGSGKSTLLRSVDFIAAPSSGTVTFAGTTYSAPRRHPWVPLMDRSEQQRSTRLRSEIGMVFQHFNVFPALDPELVAGILDLMRGLAAAGMTMLVKPTRCGSHSRWRSVLNPTSRLEVRT